MGKTDRRARAPEEDFDRRLDDGEEAPGAGETRRAGHELQRVNVDFPLWMVGAMDREAARMGVSRQALIKFVMDAHLHGVRARRPREQS